GRQARGTGCPVPVSRRDQAEARRRSRRRGGNRPTAGSRRSRADTGAQRTDGHTQARRNADVRFGPFDRSAALAGRGAASGNGRSERRLPQHHRRSAGMSHHVRTLVRRELGSYFSTPLAYVFLVIFLALMGVFTFYLGGF